MKRVLLIVLAAAFLAAGIPVFADYNRDATVKAMRDNLAGLQKAKAASASGDFYAAADGLMMIAKGALTLAPMDPPKGSKEEWAADQKLLAMAAFKGIGACGNQDKTALDAALNDIGAAMKKGHTAFKG
jgi:hypothetical protein